jgi:eukaryotic-like serine/threonine-protein kinase
MGLTQHGSLVGTPKYVAPEYIEAGECDHRGDIFALGVMAYEMVTGTSPYKSSNERALLRERFTVSTGDLERLAPQCPAELFRFIRKAMSVSVNERYQSAVEVMEELERIRTLRDKVLFEESEAPAPREEPVPESAVVSGSLRVETPAVTKRQWLTMAGSVVAILGALAGAALSR